MAQYRQINTGFWKDTKIEDFSVNEKLIYLYLLTNSLTNMCGCYELSLRQMSYETGINLDATSANLERLSAVHDVILYDRNTKEVLVKNWWKYNWTKSPRFIEGLLDEIKQVRAEDFRVFLGNKLADFLCERESETHLDEHLEHSATRGRRTDLSPSRRMTVFERDNYTCQYCGRKAPEVVLEIDHIVPVAKGGGNEITNLATICRECNAGKSDRNTKKKLVVIGCERGQVD